MLWVSECLLLFSRMSKSGLEEKSQENTTKTPEKPKESESEILQKKNQEIQKSIKSLYEKLSKRERGLGLEVNLPKSKKEGSKLPLLGPSRPTGPSRGHCSFLFQKTGDCSLNHQHHP